MTANFTKLFAAAAALLAIGTACSETDFRALEEDKNIPGPNIEVTPQQLVFSELASGEEEMQSFTVKNTGLGTLHVFDMYVETGEASFSLLTGTTEFILETDETADFNVAFTPTGTDNFGQILVESDDGDTPLVPVDLEGFGAVPSLLVEPASIDFGAKFVPCSDSETVTLTNVGAEPLTIDAINFKSLSSQLLLIDDNQLPLTLLEDESTTVEVAFVGTKPGFFTSSISVDSNDPRGTVVADQKAEGVYAAEITDTFNGPTPLQDVYIADGTLTDTFQVPVAPPVDILFAVDQSCSMDTVTVPLGQAFDQFINDINGATQGWNIGVATNDDGCFNSGTLSANTPSYQSVFNNAVNTGGCTSGAPYCLTESLFEVANNSLVNTYNGGCNQGFLRPGAMLHIIFVSDEVEQSGTNWSTWLSYYENYVSNPNLLKVSTIADLYNYCGDGSGAGGYTNMAAATGGEQLNVCDSAWAQYTQALASASLTAINEYNLSTPALSSSIQVTVDGSPWASGWHYDSAANSVVFTTAPNGGSNISIEYLASGALTSYTLSGTPDVPSIEVLVNGTPTTNFSYDGGNNSVNLGITMNGGEFVEINYLPANANNTFPLSQTPDPNSLVVSINGLPQQGGWHYEPGPNTIVIDTPLGGNAVVHAEYGILAVCAP